MKRQLESFATFLETRRIPFCSGPLASKSLPCWGGLFKPIPLILFTFMLLSCGCTSQSIVQDLRNVPTNSPIEVHTKDGKTYEFAKWTIDKDSSIVGTFKSDSCTWTTTTIQGNSIAAVQVNESQAAARMETITTVAGSLMIAAAVILVIDVLVHLPGIPVSFGP